MKLLFVHDHPFYKDLDGNVYTTSGSFPKKIWLNYLLNFTSVNVFGRLSTSIESVNGITSGFPDVSFYLTKNYNSVFGLLKNNGSLRNELKLHIRDSDLVLVRLPSVLGLIAIVEARKFNKPIWVEQVGNAKEAFSSHGSFLAKSSAFLFEMLNKKLIKDADFISYVTQNKLQKDYPVSDNKLSVALSDVVINKILSINDLDSERFYNDLFKICLIGGFNVRYKGQDLLLKAIALLSSENRCKIELNFIGKGDHSWVLNEAKKLGLIDNIKFIGSLEAGEQINDFLSNMSLYVQPSLTEGMPRATIEAMAMGCPVIGSKVGGIPDIVNPVFLHDKYDYKKLSEIILYLINNRGILYEEAVDSLKKSSIYHSSVLNNKRLDFYNEMNVLLFTYQSVK